MLCQMYFAVTVVCIMVQHVNAAVFPLGKCVDKTLPVVEVPLKQLTASERWDIIYVTDTPETHNVDKGFIKFSHNISNVYNVYFEIMTILSCRQSYTLDISEGQNENYLTEKSWDGDGNIVMFRVYTLYFIEGKVFYTYICNDSDVPGHTINADIRLVEITGGHSLTDEEKQAIFTLDSAYFEGSLYKLPQLLS